MRKLGARKGQALCHGRTLCVRARIRTQTFWLQNSSTLCPVMLLDSTGKVRKQWGRWVAWGRRTWGLTWLGSRQLRGQWGWVSEKGKEEVPSGGEKRQEQEQSHWSSTPLGRNSHSEIPPEGTQPGAGTINNSQCEPSPRRSTSFISFHLPTHGQPRERVKSVPTSQLWKLPIS